MNRLLIFFGLLILCFCDIEKTEKIFKKEQKIISSKILGLTEELNNLDFDIRENKNSDLTKDEFDKGTNLLRKYYRLNARENALKYLALKEEEFSQKSKHMFLSQEKENELNEAIFSFKNDFLKKYKEKLFKTQEILNHEVLDFANNSSKGKLRSNRPKKIKMKSNDFMVYYPGDSIIDALDDLVKIQNKKSNEAIN